MYSCMKFESRAGGSQPYTRSNPFASQHVTRVPHPETSLETSPETSHETLSETSTENTTVKLPCGRLDTGHRSGFFLGDGAGVGKGRQIAGLVYEHYRSSGRRALWVRYISFFKRSPAHRSYNQLHCLPRCVALQPQSAVSRSLLHSRNAPHHP